MSAQNAVKSAVKKTRPKASAAYLALAAENAALKTRLLAARKLAGCGRVVFALQTLGGALQDLPVTNAVIADIEMHAAQKVVAHLRQQALRARQKGYLAQANALNHAATVTAQFAVGLQPASGKHK
jgi:hypothetical protein